jgi:hypothetical protein
MDAPAPPFGGEAPVSNHHASRASERGGPRMIK